LLKIVVAEEYWSHYSGNKWFHQNKHPKLTEILPYNHISQVVLTEKDSEKAKIEAASTGEEARLRASLEEVKGELAHIKDQHVWFFNLY
jgi:hypothetical protein